MSDSDSYGGIARYYDRVLEPMNAPLRSAGMRVFPVSEGTTVLDVGCGTGAHLEAYAEAGADCSGIDLSPAMLDVARERLGGRADITLGDATSLPYDDASFDLVFTSLFLHELEPDVRGSVLEEMVRVVRPDGRILIIDFRVGRLRWKGRGLRVLSTATERVAGASHYRNWRAYLATGGIPSIAPQGSEIDTEKIVAGGNLAIWLLRRSEADR
jgi:demethylmenaquinone methyltransferase/2-methoxy-6-polyprenyl-1,4-benzoquinol methylase